MSDQLPPKVLESLNNKSRELQTTRKTLDINGPAHDRLVGFSMDTFTLLLCESDAIARARRGDDIQSGDVELAQKRLHGRNKGSYWFVAVGSALAGAGAQGFADALLGEKGRPFIIVYASAILMGLLLLYKGTPRY